MSSDLILETITKRVTESQWWSPEELFAFQKMSINKILTHSAGTVPYYRDRLKHLVTSGNGNSFTMEQFKNIPLLKREDIQKYLQVMTSVAIPKGHQPVTYSSTSGSTGMPLTILSTALTTISLIAYRTLWMEWCNRQPGVPWISLLAENGSRDLLTDNITTRLLFLSANHPVDQQIEFLNQVPEIYLTTVPSNLEAIIKYSHKKSVPLPKILGVSTMGEAMRDGLRELCMQTLNLRIMDAYGSQEMGFIACQCPKHDHYHVMAGNVFMELLRDDGSECEPGERGRVVLTSLTNYASPIIRYEINDYAEAGEPCDCGRGYPVIRKILGRERNMFVTPSGQRFYPVFSQKMGELAKEISVINQIQLIQTSLADVTVRMVASKRMDVEQESRFKSELGAALDGHFNLNIQYVDEIPRHANGKFEDAICNIQD